MPRKLRTVELQGPLIPHPDSPTESQEKAFWIAELMAPEFGASNVTSGASPADRVHPVRTLTLDGEDRDADTPERNPRLASLHLIAGVKTGQFYSEDPEPYPPAEPTDATFSVRLKRDVQPKSVTSPRREEHTQGKYEDTVEIVFRTPGRDAGGQEQPAWFHHVIAAPLLGSADRWPYPNKKGIWVPPFRLVQGSIPLVGPWKGFPFLGKLPVVRGGVGMAKDDVRLVLTADGIELDATMPFPLPDGTAGDGTRDLTGTFLLAPDSEGTVRLTLLPDRLSEERRAEWLARWRQLRPADDEILTGYKIEQRTGSLPPAFSWVITSKNGHTIDGYSDTITVPGPEVRVRLRSPRGLGGVVDGEVSFQPAAWALSLQNSPGALEQLGELAGGVWDRKVSDWGGIATEIVQRWRGVAILTAVILPPAPAAREDRRAAPGTALCFAVANGSDATASETVLTRGALEAALRAFRGPDAEHPLAHDEIRLAQALRAAHGLPQLAPGTPDPQVPVLSAFAPLSDGWLQLFAPNCPPSDTSKDTDFVTPLAPLPPNVLPGFLRFGESGEIPDVLSAFPDRKTGSNRDVVIDRAPWIVTIEGAEAVALAIGLGAPEKMRAATVIVGPELSTRGLLWLSSDRPDALEGLPRLGAGAGEFLDVPLESQRGLIPALALTLRALEFSVTAADERPWKVTRTDLAIDAAFDAGAPSWTALFVEDGQGRSATRDATAETLRLLTGEVLAEDVTPILPPVVWQRHREMPLAAIMPMTRFARSAVRPLESRDYVAFALRTPRAGDTAWIARLQWKGTEVFPRLLDSAGKDALRLRPVQAWPWPRNDEQGLGLVAFGVPGAELVFPATIDEKKPLWEQVLYGFRFDLPALDEAFATAALPPVLELPSPDERESGPPIRVATALDWPALVDFWRDQDRCHQLARVRHSHLLRKYVSSGTSAPRAVQDLIGGGEWSVSLDFRPAGENERLPYGKLLIAGQEQSGNEALEGYSGRVNLTRDGAATWPIDVTGYAVPSILAGEHLIDARGVGTGVLVDTGKAYARSVITKTGAGRKAFLITLKNPLNVAGKKDGAPLFNFWFKDVPTDFDETASGAAAGVDLEAWQDEHLPFRVMEWRLWTGSAASAEIALNIFARGRDRLPFFGFGLEPLRLVACEFAADRTLAKATLLCRLHLGPRKEREGVAGNLARLVLSAAGETTLKIESFELIGEARFGFIIRPPDGGATRRVTVALQTAAGGWNNGEGVPKFEKPALMVELHQQDVALTDATLVLPTAIEAPVVIKWKAPSGPLGNLQLGVFRIRTAELTVATEITAPVSAPIFTCSRSYLLLPAAIANGPTPMPVSGTGPVAAGDTEHLDSAFCLKVDSPALGSEKVSVWCWRVLVGEGEWRETRETVSVTTQGKVSALLPGLLGPGRVSLGFLARIGEVDGKTGRGELTAGKLDGQWFADAKGPDSGDRVFFTAHRRLRARNAGGTTGSSLPAPDQWDGALVLHRRLRVTNAIEWPLVQLGPVDIPWPGQSPNGSDELRLTGQRVHHHVLYVLDGHEMEFGVALALARGDPAAAYTVAVAARHTLSPLGENPPEPVRFSSVETIVIGGAAAVIAPEAPTSFAARYKNKTNAENGMLRDGKGRLSSVLAGAIGAGFRIVFQAPPGVSLIGGGFVGLIGGTPGAEMLPVRIPVLASLVGEGQSQPFAIRQNESDPVRVAWTDGRAARDIAARLRTAATPTSTHVTALRRAFRAGAQLPPGEFRDTEIELALLVEQCVVAESKNDGNTDRPQMGSLERTLFFPAAAVSISKLMQARVGLAPTVVSFLSGFGLRRALGADAERWGLAASVLTRGDFMEAGVPESKQQSEAEEEKGDRKNVAGLLVTLGQDVVIGEWRGPTPGLAGEPFPIGMIAPRAFADHATPVGALIAAETTQGYVYHLVPLPATPRWARFVAPPGADNFADGGRGFPLAPTSEADGVLRGIEEGPATPFRDDASTHLSGLSRTLALPAQARSVAAGAEALWLSQQRVPVYHPLRFTQLVGPAIPALSPAAPRPRLPTRQALQALEHTLLSGGAGQPILPAAATLASVGDRAGILMARTTRIEIPVTEVGCFDEDQARFGRPANASVVSFRTERTPRPGPLPENVGGLDHPDPQADPVVRARTDEIYREARNRRPCASRLLPRSPLEALRGPADTVSGDSYAGDDGVSFGPWVAKFVAAADWHGMMTESFDGTVALDVELDVHSTPDPTNLSPVGFLQRTLAPKRGKNALQASAVLVVGTTVLPFRRLHLLEGEGAKFAPVAAADRGVSLVGGPLPIHSARLRLVLDARPDTVEKVPGPAILEIAAALRDATKLPRVEIQLTLHPDSGRDTVPQEELWTSDTPQWLKVDAGQFELPNGTSRPPVTLRFPLAPVVRARGALPLAATSLLFRDPAYDAGLGAAPVRESLPVKPIASTPLPAGRGDLLCTLYTDRPSVNRHATLAFMIDLAFARPLSPVVRANAKDLDGDLTKVQPATSFVLKLAIVSRSGARRDVFVGTARRPGESGYQLPPPPPVKLKLVYELPLQMILEVDGAPAQLAAGDLLELQVGERFGSDGRVDHQRVQATIWDVGKNIELTGLSDAGLPVSRALRILLTDEPVVEPPPALYAALVRLVGRNPAHIQLSLPLYAQSPLPWRVDLRNAKQDFREGFVRRAATFVWSHARPKQEAPNSDVFVFKMDRNGQAYFPSDADFIPPRSLHS